MIDSLLKEFGLCQGTAEATITPIHQGLINHTWKVAVNGNSYILQRVNTDVFRNPKDIDDNIAAITRYLDENVPAYFFVHPLPSLSGQTLVSKEGEGCYRAFPYVAGSQTKSVVQTAAEAFEAARQFARFTAVLSGFDAQRLKATIPDFHNLNLRFNHFSQAVSGADADRRTEAAPLIRQLQASADIVQDYDGMVRNPDFRLRVTHHDTKISNVLFDGNDRGICVIDLDTVMPGYFVSDVGDMMRTYLCPVSEEETDFDKIRVRTDVYEAIVAGYLSEMKGQLTGDEKRCFFYAATFMVYMQALRFLTDYLNGDVYYKSAYPGHNLNRARNQTVLLQRIRELEPVLKSRPAFLPLLTR